MMKLYFKEEVKTIQMCLLEWFFSIFFQAEDGIRYSSVTGVQTCALPISQAEESVKEHDVGDECRNQQHVYGQARRARHEWRDKNGCKTVAFVLDGAGGHDGGNCAGICRKQRDECFSVEANGAHNAIGDERSACEIA